MRRLAPVLAALALTLLAGAKPAHAQSVPGGSGPVFTYPGDIPPDVVLPGPASAPVSPVPVAPVPIPVPVPAPIPAPVPAVPLVTTPTVAGRVARLRTDGRAAIPRGAPPSVRRVIAAANQIVGKPYKWGGGHASVVDGGYDCSGSVSYALIRAGLLPAPLVSGSFARWGSAGAGRWTAIYANAGHVYLEVAGLRLDTSAVGDPAGRPGVRWRPLIGRRPGFHTRHVTGL